VTRTPRSLLKSESVVSYLARTAGGGAGAVTSRGAGGTGAGAAGRSPGMWSTTGATPRGAGAAAAGAAGDGTRQRVDVDKWLLERRAREEAREKSQSSKMHKDARFIERLERQQEVRNAGLAAEEDRRRHAAAAAAQWQVQQYKPLQGEGARGSATGEGTSEEQMLRKDAQRLFGHAAAVPQLVAGAKGGALLPEQPREGAGHHGSSRLADVVLKAAAAASVASSGADGHRSLSSRLSGKVGASGGSLRSSVSDTPGSRRGSMDMNVRGSLNGGEEKPIIGSPRSVAETSPVEKRETEQPEAAAEKEAEAPAAAAEAPEAS
jgi:hypothetical protein